MSEFEKPSYLSESGKNNINTLKFLIGSTEATLDALERRMSNAPEASVASIEAQIRASKEKLSKLQQELSALENENTK